VGIDSTTLLSGLERSLLCQGWWGGHFYLYNAIAGSLGKEHELIKRWKVGMRTFKATTHPFLSVALAS
jgi:hypothetical protein